MSTTNLTDLAASFQSELVSRRQEIEDGGRLPQDLSSRFVDAGFYRMMIPQSYGGLEQPIVDSLRVMETLAEADASSAWCVFVTAASGSLLAWMERTAATGVCEAGQPALTAVFAPSGKAERLERGFHVSGTWHWGTNCQNADWIAGCCQLFERGESMTDNGMPANRMMLVPASDAVVADRWEASGLCGTGSADFTIPGAMVPFDRVLTHTGPAVVDGALYRIPHASLLALGIGAVCTGIARAAIDDLVALAPTKRPTGSRRPLSAQPTTLTRVATAEAALRASRSYLFATANDCWEKACAGPLTDGDDTAIRLAALNATRSCRQVVDAMYDLAGGTVVYRSTRLQQLFRDIHTATQHAAVGENALERCGQALLGVDTDAANP